MPLILGLGILSNSTFLFVVCTVKYMRSITGCYLANLAFADMTFLLAAVLPKIINYLGSPIYPDSTPIGHYGCIIGYVSSNICYFASLFFITYISWERFRAVCRPHQKPTTWRFVARLCVITWALCFGFSLTFIPAFGEYKQQCITYSENETYLNWPRIRSSCIPVSAHADSYAGSAQTFPFFVCFAVNMVFYTFIIRGLRASMLRLQRHSSSSRGSVKQRMEQERASIQITRMLLINGFLFFFLLSPFEFLSLTRSVRLAISGEEVVLSDKDASMVTYVFQFLSYTNSIINPVIYTAFSRRFRQAFRIAFCGENRGPEQQYIGTVEEIRLNSSIRK